MVRESSENVTPLYCDWPRLPRVLKAVKLRFGRDVAVHAGVQALAPSKTSGAPGLLMSARS